VEFLLQSVWEAIQMILRLEEPLVDALTTSLRVAGTSTIIASLISLPLGLVIARFDFPGKRVVLSILRTALALPTVVVGLFVYAFIARNAPLGSAHLLFTQTAIVIGQVFLIVPLMTALLHTALQEALGDAYEEARLLGAGPLAATLKVVSESRMAVVTALMTGFGRVVSEVGVSLVLGGNIRCVTRTITTAITLETSQGEFGTAFALGIVLLLLVLLVNISLQLLGGRHEAI